MALNRFRRIRDEFGTYVFLRILLMLVGSIGMAALGYFGFGTFLPSLIVIAGFILNWLLRKQIVANVELFSRALPIALVSYGVIVFVGDKLLGMTREVQLITLTAVTIILFGIQFWSLSDPEIVKIPED